MITLSIKELAKVLNIGITQVNTYLGHYSLTKFLTRKEMQTGKRILKCNVFIVCPESIAALYEYLKVKKAYSGKRSKLNIARIYKLKQMYDKSTSNDVVKNEN